MRLNKVVEKKFKYNYAYVMEDIRASLLVIAAISVALNTMSGPILGIKALLIFITSWYTAYFTEVLYFMFSKEIEYDKAKTKVKGSYPEVIALIFALLIPVGTPLFAIIISLSMGIVIAKIAFGGFSHNIFNVPVVAALICYISWPELVTPVLSSNYWLDFILIKFGELLQTPLWGILATPDVVSFSFAPNAAVIYPTWSMFTNNPQVMLGLIPSIIILVIGLRLIVNKAIDYKIPLMISCMTVIGGFIINFFMQDASFLQAVWYGFNGLFGTIMVFVAIFVASDPVTTPESTNTQFIYSMIVVIVTLYIREVSTNIEGVLYGILFANMLVPMLRARSGTLSSGRVKSSLATACAVFVVSMLFIGYNTNEEEISYIEYSHYSLGTEGAGSCTPAVDTEASASTATGETAPPPSDCEESENTEIVDTEASASVA